MSIGGGFVFMMYIEKQFDKGFKRIGIYCFCCSELMEKADIMKQQYYRYLNEEAMERGILG